MGNAALILLCMFAILTLPLSCTQFGKKDIVLQQQLRPPLESGRKNKINQAWVQLWKTARSQSEESCSAWKQLSTEPQFPLAGYAQIADEFLCQKSTKKATEANLALLKATEDNDDSTTLRWKAEILEIAAPQTTELADDIYLAEINLRLATMAKDQEAYLLQLVELSQKLNQPELVEKWQQKLWKTSPRLKPHVQAHDWPLVARNFRAHLNYPQALRYYKKSMTLNTTAEKKWDLWRQFRFTYKLAQQKESMLKIDKKWDLWTEKKYLKTKNLFWSEKLLETRLTVARALWTEEKRSQAEKLLQKTKRQFKKSRVSLSEVDFILGRMQEQDKNWDGANRFYSLAIQAHPDSDIKDKILWAQAWLLYKVEKYPEAQSAWEQILSASQDKSLKFRSQYWMARAIEMQKPGSAFAQFKDLAETDHLGFYGILAQRQIKVDLKPIPKSSAELSYDILAKAGIPADLLLAVEWSQYLREKNILVSTLKKIESQVNLHNDPIIEFEYARLQAQAGQFLPLFAKVSTLEPSARQKVLAQDSELLFPNIIPEYVEQVNAQYHYSSSLVFAIIRQESAFDPLARSPADALGLMQLLPLVAANSSLKAGVEWKENNQLYDSQTNIQLGSYELERLLKKWDQQYIPAIASYNASEKAVKGWLKSRFRSDPIEFIEEIPYEETRNYIKLVLRNYIFYERMKRKQPFAFPEELLVLRPEA